MVLKDVVVIPIRKTQTTLGQKHHAIAIGEIPPTGVGGWFRSSLQKSDWYAKEIPPTAVGGLFRSDLLFALLRRWRLDLNNPPTAVGGIPTVGIDSCRKDLNHLPTSVG